MNHVITKAGQTVAKNSPTILTVGGVIGIGVTIFLACRATLKAQKVVEDHHERREKLEKTEEISDKEYTRELAKVYSKTIINMSKLYAVPVVLGVASIVSILGGHKILSERNVKLTNSLAAMTTSYNELNKFMQNYRKRVKEAEGEDKDREYAFGLKSDKIETVDENGKATKIKNHIHTADGTGKLDQIGPYSFVFEQGWTEYKNSSALNRSMLLGQQNVWNDIYNSRKNQSHSDGKIHPVYLNEILDSLGSPERVNPRIGWNPCDEENGDGFIDFGCFDCIFPVNEAFKNGFSTKCILDFNCDGDVSEYEGAPVPDGLMNK